MNFYKLASYFILLGTCFSTIFIYYLLIHDYNRCDYNCTLFLVDIINFSFFGTFIYLYFVRKYDFCSNDFYTTHIVWLSLHLLFYLIHYFTRKRNFYTTYTFFIALYIFIPSIAGSINFIYNYLKKRFIDSRNIDNEQFIFELEETDQNIGLAYEL